MVSHTIRHSGLVLSPMFATYTNMTTSFPIDTSQ